MVINDLPTVLAEVSPWGEVASFHSDVISLLHSLVLHLCWKVLVCLIVDLFRHEEFLVKFGRVVPIECISAERERLLSQTNQDFRQVSKLQIIRFSWFSTVLCDSSFTLTALFNYSICGERSSGLCCNTISWKTSLARCIYSSMLSWGPSSASSGLR